MRIYFTYIQKVLLVFACLFASTLPVIANDPILLNDYAVELVNHGDYEKALEQLQKAYNLFPYNEKLRRNLTTAYVLAGKRQMTQNRFDEAADSFDAARELMPDNKRYGVLRGIAFYVGKRYSAAEIEFERALDGGVKTVELLYYLGRLNYDTDNLAGALKAWEQALVLDPGNVELQALLEKTRREHLVEFRMDKEYSSRFNLTYDTNVASNLAGEILDVLETAYNRVGRDLNYFPTSRIPVIIYTRKDYRALIASPDWSGGLYDGKIRIPVGGASEITPLLKSALIHEYTHVVVSELTNGHCPTWFNEGLAEVEGRIEYNPPMAELGKCAKYGCFHSLKILEGPFVALPPRDVALAYQQSYSMVNFFVSTYGWHKVTAILINLGLGMSVDNAISKALSGLGLNYEEFVGEWRTYMWNEFGN